MKAEDDIDYSLASEVNEYLSKIVNAVDKENAKEIIAESAGMIQLIVQKYCEL